MNILICDDNPVHAGELNRLLHNTGSRINTRLFHNGSDVLDYFQTGAIIDVCFLDIVMPEMTGIMLAKELRQYNYTGEIIFLSTSREYAPESYEVKAFSYLLKPAKQESVNAVLDELLTTWKNQDVGSIVLKISGAVKPVLFREISYVEVIQHEVYFHLIHGDEIAVYATFAEIAAELLNDPRFVQCHRSYIVNMEDILEISKKEIIMSSGAKIAISRTHNDIKHKYFEWEFGANRK